MGLSLRSAALVVAGLGMLAVPAQAITTAKEEGKLLRARMTAEARRTLAGYDAHLRAHPDDPEMAIERCRFSWYASNYVDDLEEVDDGGEVEEDAADCEKELEERFPKEPVVLLFRLSHTWGEEGLALAKSILADTSVEWPDPLRAKLWEDFAWKQWAFDRFPEASRAAREATRLDSSLDLSLILAKGLSLDGQPEKAIEILTAGLRHEKQERAGAKAELLLELGACDVAAPLFERPELSHKTLLHARVLECQGETEAAREKYMQIDAEHWQRQETLLRLFELDLRGGDRERASASYRAFRDGGWTADPFGRHRLALTARYPSLRWELRDALGPLALTAALLFMLLLPGMVAVPVHYIGMLRRMHRGFTPDSALRWKLRHVWIASAVMLVLDAVTMFLFLPGELEWNWVLDVEEPLKHSLDALGRYGVVSFLVAAVAIVPMLRRGDLAWILRNDGIHPAVTLAAAGVLAFFFFVTIFTYIVIARAVGIWDISATAAFELDRISLFRGMRVSCGIVPFLVIIALVVPVYEEILFRWIMLDGFVRHVPFWAANLLQALVFAALHMSGALFLFFFIFGFVLGYARRLSGGLLIGILTHAGYNAGVVLLSVVFGKV